MARVKTGGCVAALRRALATGAGAVLALLSGVAALLALLALAGRISPPLDVLSHLAPLYGLAGVIGLATILVRSAWRTLGTALAMVTVLASGALTAPEWLRDAGAIASPANDTIKVIQINALRANSDIGRVADWLIAERPDVVTISEARHDLRDLLIRRTGWKTAGAQGDLMIFTPRAYVRMNRPQVPPASKISFVNATYAHPTGPIEIVTTHVTWPTRAIADGQRRDLEGVVAALPRHRMILTGDFNATPWSAATRRLDMSLGLIRRDRAMPSFPAQLGGRPWPVPFLPIDHVYAGPDWATVSVRRGPWLGSDHYPVVVTLAPVAPR